MLCYLNFEDIEKCYHACKTFHILDQQIYQDKKIAYQEWKAYKRSQINYLTDKEYDLMMNKHKLGYGAIQQYQSKNRFIHY